VAGVANAGRDSLYVLYVAVRIGSNLGSKQVLGGQGVMMRKTRVCLSSLPNGLALLFVLLALELSASGHERWARDEPVSLEGEVVEYRPGNPHHELLVETLDDGLWVVELGQPWRLRRAGLSAERLEVGENVQVQGWPAEDKQRRLKAVRVVVDGRNFHLHPRQID
jgi:hypothetical protein